MEGVELCHASLQVGKERRDIMDTSGEWRSMAEMCTGILDMFEALIDCAERATTVWEHLLMGRVDIDSDNCSDGLDGSSDREEAEEILEKLAEQYRVSTEGELLEV